MVETVKFVVYRQNGWISKEMWCHADGCKHAIWFFFGCRNPNGCRHIHTRTRIGQIICKNKILLNRHVKCCLFLRCKRYNLFFVAVTVAVIITTNSPTPTTTSHHFLFNRTCQKAFIESTKKKKQKWRRRGRNGIFTNFTYQRQNRRTTMTDQIYSCRCRCRCRWSLSPFFFFVSFLFFFIISISFILGRFTLLAACCVVRHTRAVDIRNHKLHTEDWIEFRYFILITSHFFAFSSAFIISFCLPIRWNSRRRDRKTTPKLNQRIKSESERQTKQKKNKNGNLSQKVIWCQSKHGNYTIFKKLILLLERKASGKWWKEKIKLKPNNAKNSSVSSLLSLHGLR